MWNHCKSTVFLDYIRNTLHIVATHTKAFHISENNLPVLTDKYDKSVLPSGIQPIRQVWLTLGDPSDHQFAIPLVHHHGNEEIKDVMNATAAGAA